MDLRTDDEDAPGTGGPDEAVRRRQREEEAGALRAQVERPDRVAAELVLQEAGRAREGDVRGHGREDEEVEVPGTESRGRERGQRRVTPQVRRADPGLGVVAAHDPGPLGDHLPAETELASQLLAGHDPRRQGAPAAEDGTHRHGRPRPPTPSAG